MDPFALAETEVQLFGYSQQRLLAASQRASVADHVLVNGQSYSYYSRTVVYHGCETKRTLEQCTPDLVYSSG